MLFNTDIKIYKKAVLFFSTLIIFVGLSGCTIFGSSKESDDNSRTAQISNESQQKHYNRAASLLESNKFEDALEVYNEFIIKYPFGTLSERARLERIFVLNKLGTTEEASVAINRFIVQHPLHPSLDYAYYMRGVVLFEKKRTGIFRRMAGAKELYRNKNNYEASHQAFAELLQKFPDSRYAADAKKRMTYLRNNMAKYELSIAEFYAERNAHIGAIKRANFIVTNYDQAPAVIDALELMIESYKKIGLNDKANETRELLAANYQNIKGVSADSETKAKKAWLRLPNLNPFKSDKKQTK